MPAKHFEAPRKQDVLGIGISTTTYADVATTCAHWLDSRTAHPVARYICVTSVHGVMEARKNGSLRSILNGADIATPDGMPLVWALRSFGVSNQQRVYGPHLMLTLCAQAEEKGHRVFLYGGRPETLDILCRNLRDKYPRMVLAGSYSPPFRALADDEEQAVRAMITEARPDVIFVGISTPKQERWMSEHRDFFPGVVMIGVGAAFDFHAGRVRQAPAWVQKRGLEWLFRLTMEPARLWKRYVLVTPWFLPLWALQKLSLTMHDLACGRASRRQSLPNTEARQAARPGY